MKKENFNSLPDNEKRIALAKDVIKHLNTKKIIVSQYIGYIRNHEIIIQIGDYVADKGKLPELQPLLKEHVCQVCALGAMFVSDIMNRNKYKMDSLGFYDLSLSSISERLTFFSERQLELIEAYFEGGRTISFLDENHEEAIYFHSINPNSQKRVIKIMENIINNNGEFIPEKLY